MEFCRVSPSLRLSSSVTRTKDKPPFEYLRGKPQGAREIMHIYKFQSPRNKFQTPNTKFQEISKFQCLKIDQSVLMQSGIRLVRVKYRPFFYANCSERDTSSQGTPVSYLFMLRNVANNLFLNDFFSVTFRTGLSATLIANVSFLSDCRKTTSVNLVLT